MSGPLIWQSALWGLVSALSLTIGSIIGVTCLPSQKICAVLMSFGGGALLFALAIELFGHTLHEAKTHGSNDPVWAMECAAILGGCLFAGLNRVLNSNGADIRKASLSATRFKRLRGMLARRLVRRVGKLELFAGLNETEVKELIFTGMHKQNFRAGDVILDPVQAELNVYFIMSGRVQFDIFPIALFERPLTESATEVSSCDSKNNTSLPSLRNSSPRLVRCGTMGTQGTKGVSQVSIPTETFKLGADCIFGEMLARQATALDNTKLLVLPAHQLTRLIENHDSVRRAMVVRMLARIRRVNMPHAPVLAEDALAGLSARSELEIFQAKGVVFKGKLSECSAGFCVGLGSIEIKQDGSADKLLRAEQVLKSEGFTSDRPVKVTALERTITIRVPTSDLVLVCGEQSTSPITSMIDGTKDDSMASQLRLLCRGVDPARMFPGEVPGDAACKLDLEELETHTPDAPTPSTQATHTSPGDARPSPGGKRISLCWLDNDTDMPESGRPGFLTESSDLGTPSSGSKQRRSSKMGRASLEAAITAAAPDQSFDLPHELVTDEELDERFAWGLAEAPKGEDTPMLQRSGSVDDEGGGGSHSTSHAAVMVWLGILIDAVPESLVIGILVNKADGSVSAVMPFIMGVFLSNLPESMSSSGMMKKHGMSVKRILLMWLTITVITAAGAAAGACAFPPGSFEEPSTRIVVSAVEGLAAGAMLTMIAQTMMPEAFGQGGDIVGLSCLVGFLCALSMKMLPSD